MALDVWAMSPEQLAACGLECSATSTFATLQRPWRWGSDGPTFGKRIQSKLSGFDLALPRVIKTSHSDDGATKLLLGFDEDRIETLHMPRRVATDRVTICLSSQVGCSQGCRFCATARLGFNRHLTAGEIVTQLLVVLRQLGPRHPSDLTLVFMGMGEPLANLTAVRKALEILCHPAGLGLSPRRITLSTAGLLPEIDQLSTFTVRPLLAVSLNATTDELRQQLMPVSRRYSLDDLRKTLERYPVRARERITVEYILLRGVNDSVEDAQRLAHFVAGFAHHINLIVFNEFDGSGFSTPTERAIDAFARSILSTRPTVVTVRRSRGRDVQGACGNLVREGFVAH